MSQFFWLLTTKFDEIFSVKMELEIRGSDSYYCYRVAICFTQPNHVMLVMPNEIQRDKKRGIE